MGISESGPEFPWFERTLKSLEASPTKEKLLQAYTAATRKLGKPFDDDARAAFLIQVSCVAEAEFYDLALACYEMGDASEQASWLRGLSRLPDCGRFLATAIDACRTNILPLFESIACENPYPMLHFPELNFNQMVMKSLFNGIALSRIVGLESRLNADLSRMAGDYRSELEAAGRPVPADIGLVIARKD
jgi:hypothetical protein